MHVLPRWPQIYSSRMLSSTGEYRRILGDRDARFTGRFWTSLFELMGTKLNFSTTNHPQTDGQTEGVNGLLEEYLRHLIAVNQHNWVDLLDIAKFCYNLKLSSATGASLFELAIGQQPLTPNELAYDIIVLSGPLPFRLKKDQTVKKDQFSSNLWRSRSFLCCPSAIAQSSFLIERKALSHLLNPKWLSRGWTYEEPSARASFDRRTR